MMVEEGEYAERFLRKTPKIYVELRRITCLTKYVVSTRVGKAFSEVDKSSTSSLRTTGTNAKKNPKYAPSP